MQKIINEVLAHDSGMAFARETRDLLIECCVEFITMVSSEANEISEKEAKKTIACEHITKALQELGFAEYVPDLLEVAQQFKTQHVVSIPYEPYCFVILTIYSRARRSRARLSRAVLLRKSFCGSRRSCSDLQRKSSTQGRQSSGLVLF